MDNKKQKTWTIELTEKQLIFIAETLEFASRFHCGQIGVTYIPYPTRELLYNKDNWQEGNKRQEQFNALADLMKSVMHKDLMPHHGSYGIGFDEYTDELYDMYKMIRYKLHQQQQKENPDEDLSYSVHSTFHKVVRETPPLKVELKENE